MLLECPKSILLEFCTFLDLVSNIYFNIVLNACKPNIKAVFATYENEVGFKRLNVAACLEGCCFNGRKDLLAWFWRLGDHGNYESALRGACKNNQIACANWILKQPIATIFISEILFIVLKSKSDDIVSCFLRNVNINRISKREWSHLWNSIENDNFSVKWMNLVQTRFTRFSTQKQFTTQELMFAPNYRM